MTNAVDQISYSQMTSPRPDETSLRATYGELFERFDAASSKDDRKNVLMDWDQERRHFQTWSALARLQFAQDTADESAKSEREYADELSAVVTELDVELKRRFLEAGRDVAEEIGDHAFELWTSDITAFQPEIREETVAESKRSADYTELISSADLEFRGESYNISGITKFLSDSDRQTRYEASKVVWSFFEENGAEIDTIYDDLVKLRHTKAKKLGFENFVGLGYREMQRVDYDAEDVERFRAQVRDEIVPLCTKLREEQAQRLGVDKLMQWDESVHDLSGNPKPEDDVDTVVKAGIEMFDQMDPELSSFFRMMVDRELLDLDTRKGKAGGGFCTSFSDYDVPFIFANFNGTKHDVEVVTHEIGHAFQCWSSRHQKPLDYLWPTLESCEIHSMSLEFLCWPHMELFFGDDADRFRRIHLIESLLFLPYGCAVDHFQHLVYANPDATPEERHGFWQEMEATYLPHRDWGDLAYPAKGARWQRQGHIFGAPFYYIDYVLAMTCALQYWDKMQSDMDGAMKSYVALCKRGGEAPFQELARAAGVISPFEDGCLSNVVARATEWLDV